jgi:peptide deformylase
MIKIIQNGDPVLRKIAKEIPVTTIIKDKCQKIIKDMKSALHSQDDGVAIAAPQIGVSLRIFIISGRIFDEDFMKDSGTPVEKFLGEIERKNPDLVFINPVFKKISKDKKNISEGCLSVRPIYGKVRRATRVTVEAHNEHGIKSLHRYSSMKLTTSMASCLSTRHAICMNQPPMKNLNKCHKQTNYNLHFLELRMSHVKHLHY